MRKINEKAAEKVHTIEDCFYLTGCIILAVVLILAAGAWKGVRLIKLPPCLFHLLTGYYCPGCGGTRALSALFQGHVLRSFCYHPIVIYGAAIYGCFMITQTVERLSRHRIRIGMHYHNGYVWTAAAIIIINFLIRNLRLFYYGISI